jgi:uncharacterized membrane protein YfcA
MKAKDYFKIWLCGLAGFAVIDPILVFLGNMPWTKVAMSNLAVMITFTIAMVLDYALNVRHFQRW